MTIEEIRKKSTPFFERSDVAFAGVFGSFARGDAREDSDIDVVIRFREGNNKSLLDFFALQDELEQALKRPVDLATERSLHPRLRETILRELQPIYGSR